MCGLSGAAGTLSEPEKKVVTDLLVLNIVRGADSSGIASVDRQKPKANVNLVRAVGTPFGDHGENPGLFGLKAFDKLIKGTSKCLIGHNRSGTRGEVIASNAHPFKFSSLVGAHNGTISYNTVTDLIGHETYGTDSEALFNTLQQKGVEGTVPLLEKIGAITWYDSRNDTFNMYRDKERPLHYILSENGQTLFWSSDISPLLYALYRQKIVTGTGAKVSMLPEDTWLSWKLPESYMKFSDPVLKVVKGKQPPVYRNTDMYGKGYYNQGVWKEGTWPGTESDFGDDYGCLINNGYQYDQESGIFVKKDTNKSAADSAQVLLQHREDVWAGEGNSSGKTEPAFKTIGENPSGEIETAEGTIEDTDKSVQEAFGVLLPFPCNDAQAKKSEKRIVNRLQDAVDTRFKEQFKTLPLEHWKLKHSDTTNKVFFDPQIQRWFWFHYQHVTNKFIQTQVPVAPKCVPFTKLNVDSGGSHLFKYDKIRISGTKKRQRVIMYKGYNKDLLVQQRFNELMSCGCMNCQRQPEWGNPVRFFTHVDFLCEYCSSMPDVVKLTEGLVA